MSKQEEKWAQKRQIKTGATIKLTIQHQFSMDMYVSEPRCAMRNWECRQFSSKADKE